MPRVSEQHRAARREQILAAASRCVAQEGFHKTTIADVIAEAGLSAGAVYGYFRSKAEIIAAIADTALAPAADRLHDLLTGPGPVHPADAVEVVLRQVLARDRSKVDMPRVAVQAWAEAVRDPQIHVLAREKMGALRDAVVAVVRRCQADGTVAPHLDPQGTGQVLFSLLPGFVLQHLILEEPSVEAYIEGVRGLVG